MCNVLEEERRILLSEAGWDFLIFIVIPSETVPLYLLQQIVT